MTKWLIFAILFKFSLGEYEAVGCYKDTITRAITLLEWRDPALKGDYRLRANATTKCAMAAARMGYTMFALQNGGQCASSATAAETFYRYGSSIACNSDGKGGFWANQVYRFKDYEAVGCYKDTANRAITLLENKDPVLDQFYYLRMNPIAKCAVVARRRGYSMFAIQNGGQCATSVSMEKTFDKYGNSSACNSDGKGGPWANQVYRFKDYQVIGCFKDAEIRAIPKLEEKDPVLDKYYKSRTNAIAKCAVAAKRAGYAMFALQHGGWCASSATAAETFYRYGSSSACNSDGEGGPWANQVYRFKDIDECKTGRHDCHKRATCVNNFGSFSCVCKTGFTGSGKHCEDVDECAVGKPCQKGTQCINTIGSFSCYCETGFNSNGTNGAICDSKKDYPSNPNSTNNIFLLVSLTILSGLFLLLVTAVAVVMACRKKPRYFLGKSWKQGHDVTGHENKAQQTEVEIGDPAVKSNYATLDVSKEEPANCYQSLNKTLKSSTEENEYETPVDHYSNRAYIARPQSEVEIEMADYVIPASCEDREYEYSTVSPSK